MHALSETKPVQLSNVYFRSQGGIGVAKEMGFGSLSRMQEMENGVRLNWRHNIKS